MFYWSTGIFVLLVETVTWPQRYQLKPRTLQPTFRFIGLHEKNAGKLYIAIYVTSHVYYTVPGPVFKLGHSSYTLPNTPTPSQF